MTKISLVVPVYNALKETKACMNSILKNFDFLNGEVFIIDDCSTLKTERYLKHIAEKYGDKVTVCRNETNLGFLKSCNDSVKKVCGEVIVFLNSDCEIPQDFVSRVLACFESDISIVAASPVASNSAKYFIPQIFPFGLMDKALKRLNPVYPEVYNSEGFCFCVRKSYIDEVGLFDTIYGRGYCEEVDFCFAAKARGKKCVLIDNLYVKHSRNKSFGLCKTALLSHNNKIFYNRWADYINKYEQGNFINPISKIIEDGFKGLSKLLFFTIKLRNQFLPNRLHCIKNIFKQWSRNQKDKVIYTCICGNYDIIPVVHDFYNNEWDYVCFTDNKTLLKCKRFGMWQIRPLVFDKADNTRNARWHKTHPYLLFPEYKQTLWLDANINVKTEYLFKCVNQTESDMLIPYHYCRRCIYKELEVVEAMQKDDPIVLHKWHNTLRLENFPVDYGLNETNIIWLKNKNSKIIKLMEQWWNIINLYSKRDQVSFSYILWKNNIDLSQISISNARIDIENFQIYPHNPAHTFIGKILCRLFPR